MPPEGWESSHRGCDGSGRRTLAEGVNGWRTSARRNYMGWKHSPDAGAPSHKGEVWSFCFLILNVWLLSFFLAALWWELLYLVPPLENEPKEMLPMREYRETVHSQGQQLWLLKAKLGKLHKVSSFIRAANSERIAKLMFQRLSKDFVAKPDYALSSVGASMNLEKTSPNSEDPDTAYFWNGFSFWNYTQSPTVILEVGFQSEGTSGRMLGKRTRTRAVGGA
ncbi:PREDICTED: LOW QUALITY PROTEIN: sperm associated antigen 4 [Chrysochloris asiatica]|uniref:LOW QUALITY PROTEIN: sperm associated antigen 4 n=1 Tax=Chrysochloris asiatica TaxID=185453 RepID=A0A9B0U9M6_CHRAS|nr:PREDICTED: LOW QUALITY PROTEIN: sperm associated antigen 4 [Chrysochloris asiatica]